MMAARTDISELEKRSQLRAHLVPRQTPINTQHHLNRFRGIFKAAAKHLGYRGECRFITDRDLSVAISEARPKALLNFHNTMPKTRQCWSNERLQQLLLSPLYTGCFSKHRRWRPGTIIVRDALYWVPLILMTIGSRIDELLRMNKSSIILRDGVVCFALNIEFVDDGKTTNAKRYIPVPELLLRLGFVEWARGLPGGSAPSSSSRSMKDEHSASAPGCRRQPRAPLPRGCEMRNTRPVPRVVRSMSAQ
jgi:hypothetical protein